MPRIGNGFKLSLGRKEFIGDVELVARSNLDAHWRHQHYACDAGCISGGEIGCNSATQRWGRPFAATMTFQIHFADLHSALG